MGCEMIELTQRLYAVYALMKKCKNGATTKQLSDALKGKAIDTAQRNLLSHGIVVVYNPDTKRYLMKDVEDTVGLSEDYNVRLERAKNRAEKAVVNKRETQNMEVQAITDILIEKMAPLIVPLDPDDFEPVEVRKFKGKQSHDPETMVAVISDVHVGKVTKSYNFVVAQERLNNYEAGLLSVLDIQRSWNPVDKLQIFFLGDIIDGEGIYPGQAFEIGADVLDQIFTYALPMFAKFIMNISGNFKSVKIKCVPGNHGRVSKYGSKHTNWDSVFYKALSLMLKNIDNVEFGFPEKTDFYLVADVDGNKFMLSHGAEIKSYYNTPVYQWVRHSERWRSSISRDLNYFIFGHFHTVCKGMEFNGMEILASGTFISDDQFSIQGMALTPSTKQLLFGVNKKHGITWEYSMDLTYKHEHHQ